LRVKLLSFTLWAANLTPSFFVKSRMEIKAWLFVVAIMMAALVLGFGTGRATAVAEEIIAATFADPGCTEPQLMARPQSLHDGDCVYTKPYNFYYTVSNPSGNIARYHIP
jgi:hypothetical protein